jgi:IS1 family transposase
MNRLSRDKQETIMKLLVEGSSIRSIERITGVHRDTIIRLMKRVAANCAAIMNQKMMGLDMNRVQTDEIWTYVMKHKRYLEPHEENGEYGDQFIYVAIDADTKLIPCWVVGKRNKENTLKMMIQLRRRIKNRRFQLTTDAFWPYAEAVDRVFGIDIDYGQLVKVYGGGVDEGREVYSPSDFVETELPPK